MKPNVVPSSGTETGPLDRALDLLLALADAPEPPTLSELARQLGLPKSTVHRIVGQLERRSFVERDAGLGLRLGPAVGRLGHAAWREDPLVRASQSIVDETSRELGETLFVVAARAGELVVLHKHEGTGVLRAAPTLGTTVPVHATAAGRIYLAFAPDEVRAPRGPLRAFTERTPVDRRELERRIALARERGYDENVGEWVDGLAVIAAAIRVRDGRLHGVLTCALAEPNFRALSGRGLEGRVVRTAERIAARIEGRKA